MDEIGRNYLTLALALDRHVPGLVDAYFGPSELQAEAAEGEPRPLAELADRAHQLQAAIKVVSTSRPGWWTRPSSRRPTARSAACCRARGPWWSGWPPGRRSSS
ncbi:MAG: hypothetical protein P8129_08935 [Anaerolineae bacterium]